MKAMNCPFLTRFPVGQVRKMASELLTIADRCPVMGHVLRYVSLANTDTPAVSGSGETGGAKGGAAGGGGAAAVGKNKGEKYTGKNNYVLKTNIL